MTYFPPGTTSGVGTGVEGTGVAAGAQAESVRRKSVIDAMHWLIVFMEISRVDHCAFHFNPNL
jgi:hypothetical protein